MLDVSAFKGQNHLDKGRPRTSWYRTCSPRPPRGQRLSSQFLHCQSVRRVVSNNVTWTNRISPFLDLDKPSPWEYAGHIDAKRGIQMICNDTGVLELYLYRSFSIGRYTYASRTERFAGPQVSPCSNSCCTVNGGVCS